MKEKKSKLVVACYVIAAALMILAGYSAISAVAYISEYLTVYGMSFGDMAGESIQYVLDAFIPNAVYAVLVFCAGKIIELLQKLTKTEEVQEALPEAELPEAEIVEVLEHCEAEEAVEEATEEK